MKKSIMAVKVLSSAVALFIAASVSLLSSCASIPEDSSMQSDAKVSRIKASGKNGKLVTTSSNLISPNVFCADPTAVEYKGRLYVYGTNDHQQYLNKNENTYEFIKSLVVFSTDDMVNWTYHGQINVEKIAPWIINSWAPSVCSRIEEDGLTHFYLYFSNNGCGVGVITATDPLGPWSDPLGQPLISAGMKGLDSPNPFDPGVVIDETGTGYLAFGGGIVRDADEANPCSSKIVRLGKDMISLDSRFVDTYAPYFFEASELNYINGTYIYTFNHSWSKNPGMCSMGYMTSKKPLKSSSWEYKGYYFRNPGEMGFDYSNNHTHFEKYQGKYYLFYHTLSLQRNLGIKSGMRSICAANLTVDEDTAEIKSCSADMKGVEKIKNADPFALNAGTCFYTCANIGYVNEENPGEIAAVSLEKGGWILVKNVDFATESRLIKVFCSGKGYIELRLDNVNGKTAAVLNLEDNSGSVESAFLSPVNGLHDLYFVFSDENIEFSSWQCQ